MNINGVSAQATGLLNVNRGLDNNQRQAGDIQGTGRSDRPELATGVEVNPAVAQSAVNANVAAASTQVVSESSEVLGSMIDTRV
ncbi:MULTISPECIES: hypothetical protein [Nitrincola]|uniref:Uncharacterized protein n=1 Tax=Nitrincola nitratireducens TaxID=1229521 RepID=W9UX28_9GAMM|nr:MULTISPECIES: hypothetical protein [Nitrincola]EXJ11634.1 hypothetical protein D791_01407 [Nitrincola nitratireducens]